MAEITKDTVVNLFKRVYGNITDLRPKTDVLDDILPFESTQKTGDSYVEAVQLGDEVGLTLGGDAQDAFTINPAVAGAVRQISVKPCQTVVSSVLSWGFMARAASGSEASFFDGTKHVMRSNLESHNRLLNVLRLYGHAPTRLGAVSYYTGTYRGASFTSGSGTLTRRDQSTITFTNGVNTTEKAFLMEPGEFAAGIWAGRRGMKILQLDTATYSVVAQGKVVGWDSGLGIVYVDFTPVASTGPQSHCLAFDGSQTSSPKEMMGIHRILTAQSGTVFGVDVATEPMWRGSRIHLGGSALSLRAIQEGVADAVNGGGLSDELDIIVNPRTFARLAAEADVSRRYTSNDRSVQGGFEAIEYFAPNGVNRVHASPCVKEGYAYGLVRSLWRYGGSQLPSYKVGSLDQDVIYPLPDAAGFAVRSYADTYLLCRAPARNIVFTGLNDEGALY